jgi:leader peptidase (prepilin peptidase)/N-methyltransferase
VADRLAEAELTQGNAPVLDLSGRSRCCSCGRTLGILDLVPVFSWLCLGGKCRTCRAAIPARYFWTEAGFAVLGALVAHFWRVEQQGLWGTVALLSAGLSAGLVFASAVVDARTGYVYDGIMLPALVLAALAALVRGVPGSPDAWQAAWHALVPGLTGAGIILIPVVVSLGRGMGVGDVLPMATLSLLAGQVFAFADLLMLASLAAVPFVLWKAIRLGYRNARRIPLVPFLFVGWILFLGVSMAGLPTLSALFGQSLGRF